MSNTSEWEADDPSSTVREPNIHDAVPAMFEHCRTMYNAFKSKAVEINVEGVGQALVWTGFTTKLFREQSYSVPYYSKILQHLQGMDSIRQLRRGGANTESQWVILQEPTVALFKSSHKKLSPSMMTKQGETEAMKQNTSDISRRLTNIEGKVRVLEDIVKAQSEKIQNLTTELQQVRSNPIALIGASEPLS